MLRVASLALAGLLAATSILTAARADHVDPADIIPVLPRDAIPAITEPSFGLDNPSWLQGDTRVIGVEVAGDARAYPVAILNWHEIVDDVIGGRPVAVTFCPLCGTGITFDRVVNEKPLLFKVSGNLYKNDLVMYDTETESYWSQLLGEGIMGAYHGIRLGLLTSATLAWSEWRSLHPDSKLLDRPRDSDGRFLRDYAYNPYSEYAASDSVWFPQGNVDANRTLPPKELVLGVVLGGQARAYPSSVLATRPVVNDTLGGVPVLVTYVDGAMKAWDRGNRTFQAAGMRTIVDDAGQTYDAMTGVGPASQLRELPAVTTFWFAWYDFYPATSVYGNPQPRPAPSQSPVPTVVGAAAAVLVVAVAMRYLSRRIRIGRR